MELPALHKLDAMRPLIESTHDVHGLNRQGFTQSQWPVIPRACLSKMSHWACQELVNGADHRGKLPS